MVVPPAIKSKVRRGIVVQEAIKVFFYKANIENCAHERTGLSHLGYGIDFRTSAIVKVTDSTILGCKTSVDGRHVKSMIIDGGEYRSGDSTAPYPLSCHWGNDIKVFNATLYCRGGNAIEYAGQDLVLRDNDIRDARHVVSVRLDTPDIGGVVEVKNNKVSSSSEHLRFFGTTDVDRDYGDFFGRTINWPDHLDISGNKLINNTPNTSSEHVSFVMQFRSNFAFKPISNISISNNKPIIGGAPVSFATGSNPFVIQPLYVVDSPISIDISNQEFFGSYSRMIYILNNIDDALVNKFKIKLSDVTNVFITCSIDACSEFKIRNSQVLAIKAGGDATTPVKTPSFLYDIRDSTILQYYRSANFGKVYNCELVNGFQFVGNDFDDIAQMVSSVSTPAWVISSGNFADASVPVGNLPPMDGYYASELYKHNGQVPQVADSSLSTNDLKLNGWGVELDSSTYYISFNIGGSKRRVALS
jgi:hypothetical protein